MRRAADRGDGWICAPGPDVEGQVRTITEMRKTSDRSHRPFEFCAMLKQPDASMIAHLSGVGITHFIISSPWRPELANQTDPGEKVPALKDLGEKLRKIDANL